MADSKRNDPATLQSDVREVQDDIGDTVEKLEDKLSPDELARSVLGDDGEELAGNALDIVRRNPIPVALIAVGLIWLVASSDSPPLRKLRERISGRGNDMDLRSRSEEPAPIGPPPPTGEAFDRKRSPRGR